MKQLRDSIVEAVASSAEEAVLEPLNLGGPAQNELLFFFKPECFLGTSPAQQGDLVDTALNLFAQYAVQSVGAMLFRGKQLAERQIMDRHYGFINQVSRNANTLSESELTLIKAQLAVDVTTPIYGGHEFLNIAPDFTAHSLETLWASKKSKKLRSGLYFESFDANVGNIVLLNGFHPAQLAHFTGEDRTIVMIVLQSDLPWRTLRMHLLGDTFPEKAVPGSFRRILYGDPQKFGLSKVSIAANGGHMSAGPFEAMFELSNFLSSSPVGNFDIRTTTAWKTAVRIGVKPPQVESAILNPMGQIGSAERSLFDATEELDTLSACHLFRTYW